MRKMRYNKQSQAYVAQKGVDSVADGVLAAMSGGVDSTVTALLLQQAGYHVTGAMMKLFENEDIGRDPLEPCLALESKDDAEAVAEKLDIPFFVYNLTEAFKSCVLGKFVSEYEAGRTPNPCIDCNKGLKFGALFQKADLLGCRYLATGHYAKVERNGDRYLLKKGVDEKKDQSYVLFSLTQDKLSRIILPLGGLTKLQVREVAEANGFPNASHSDSQDICFLPDGDYGTFIERFSGKKQRPGDIVDINGNKLGEHRGITRYTIGKRRGLGISSGGRLFVKELDARSNTVVLGDNDSLFNKRLVAGDINLIATDIIDRDMCVTAKIRYAHNGAAAIARQTGDNELTVTFDTPQRAITKGQYVVLYDGDTVIGGGTIDDVKD